MAETRNMQYAQEVSLQQSNVTAQHYTTLNINEQQQLARHDTKLEIENTYSSALQQLVIPYPSATLTRRVDDAAPDEADGDLAEAGDDGCIQAVRMMMLMVELGRR